MRKLLLVIALICFSNGRVFADNVAPAPQGNQGYIYGKATDPQQDAASSNTNDLNPVRDIWYGIKRVDHWIQKNLW